MCLWQIKIALLVKEDPVYIYIYILFKLVVIIKPRTIRNWKVFGRTFKFSLAYLVLKIDIIIAIMNLNSISMEFDL
jgi:hypothetical protein